MDSNLLFIGNGFDLYHQLPTRYTDFLEFANKWKVFYEEYKVQKNDVGLASTHFEVRLDKDGRLCETTLLDFALHSTAFNSNNIEYLNSHLENNIWLKFFIASDYKKEGWIDFEKTMKDAMKAIEKYMPCGISGEHIRRRDMRKLDQLVLEMLVIPTPCDLFTSEDRYFRVVNAAEDVLEQEKKKVLNNLKKSMEELCECLRLYLLEFVQRIEIKTVSPQLSALNNVSLLSVNYTNTFSRVYGIENLKKEHYVHGNVNVPQNNIVLGFDSTEIEVLDYVYFYKYFQRIQKHTGASYKTWLRTLNSLFSIHIFGHSLDITDKDILEDLFASKRITCINIYYHNQSAYESQVINLIRIFGKDSVIEHISNGFLQFHKIT